MTAPTGTPRPGPAAKRPPAGERGGAPAGCGAGDLPCGDDGYFTHHGLWSPGVRLFRQMRFTAQALVISALIAVPMLALAVGLILAHHDAAVSQRQSALREQVDIAHGLLVHAHAQERAGLMPQADAQALARNALAAMRPGLDATFWISDRQARLVMHPRHPDLIGRELTRAQTPGGLADLQAVAAQVQRHGGGGLAFRTRGNGPSRAVDAIAQVQGFEPWGWIVGTARPIDDLQDERNRQLAWAGGAFAAVLLLAGYLHVCFRQVMEGGLREAERYLRAMGEGDLSLSPRPWGSDEAARLMREFARVQEAARGMVARMRASSHALLHSSDTLAAGSGEGTAAGAAVDSAGPRVRPAAAASATGHPERRATPALARVNASGPASADRAARATGNPGSRGTAARPQDRTPGTLQLRPERIGEVLELIDAIVVRSHVLSLQAALQSVRAGAPGRGLAVLTGDVRQLARRSADSAREIKGLIGLREPDGPVARRAALPPGASLEEVVAASQRVNQLIAATVSLGEGQPVEPAPPADPAAQAHPAAPAAAPARAADAAARAAAAALREQARTLAREVARIRLPGDPPGARLNSRG